MYEDPTTAEVLTYAKRIASAEYSTEVSPEHLLRALMISFPELFGTARNKLPGGRRLYSERQRHIGRTAATWRLFRLAGRIAERVGHTRILPDHLALAMLRSKDGRIALRSLGITNAEVREIDALCETGFATKFEKNALYRIPGLSLEQLKLLSASRLLVRSPAGEWLIRGGMNLAKAAELLHCYVLATLDTDESSVKEAVLRPNHLLEAGRKHSFTPHVWPLARYRTKLNSIERLLRETIASTTSKDVALLGSKHLTPEARNRRSSTQHNIYVDVGRNPGVCGSAPARIMGIATNFGDYAYQPSGDGSPLVDPETGHAFGELVGSGLILGPSLYGDPGDTPRNKGRKTTADWNKQLVLFARMLDVAAEQLDPEREVDPIIDVHLQSSASLPELQVPDSVTAPQSVDSVETLSTDGHLEEALQQLRRDRSLAHNDPELASRLGTLALNLSEKFEATGNAQKALDALKLALSIVYGQPYESEAVREVRQKVSAALARLHLSAQKK